MNSHFVTMMSLSADKGLLMNKHFDAVFNLHKAEIEELDSKVTLFNEDSEKMTTIHAKKKELAKEWADLLKLLLDYGYTPTETQCIAIVTDYALSDYICNSSVGRTLLSTCIKYNYYEAFCVLLECRYEIDINNSISLAIYKRKEMLEFAIGFNYTWPSDSYDRHVCQRINADQKAEIDEFLLSINLAIK